MVSWNILYASPVIKEKGCKDCQVVLIQWINDLGEVKEYSTHIYTREDNGLFWGHYYTGGVHGFLNALDDFSKRVNESLPEGTIIPPQLY